MSNSQAMLIVTLDSQRLAIPLEAVERIVAAVEVTPLPQAPPVMRGVINVAGQVVAVLDLRVRYGLPPREVELTDQLVITRTSRRRIALLVDSAEVVRAGEEVASGAAGTGGVRGVLRHGAALTPVIDPGALLSAEEERALPDPTATPGGGG
jgi:purine-binding chemotaxis protein CheW